MYLVFDKIKHARVLDTTLWVSKCGTSVFKEQQSGNFRKVKITKALSRGVPKMIVGHEIRGLTVSLARLVLLAWRPYPNDYKNFRVVIKNGNTTDLDVNNLCWLNWLEVLPDNLKQVLDRDIYISKDGLTAVQLNPSGDWIKQLSCKAAKGYYTIDHSLKALTKLRHRLVALAWNNPPDNWEELEVNHLNSVRGDDFSENLEWCTKQENVEHAVKYGNLGSGKVYVKNLLTGESSTYNSLRSSITAIGGKESRTNYSNAKRTVRILNGFSVSYSKTTTATRKDILLQTEILYTDKESKQYKAKTIRQLALKLGLDSSALRRKINKYGSVAIKGGNIQFVTGDVTISVDRNNFICSHREI